MNHIIESGVLVQQYDQMRLTQKTCDCAYCIISFHLFILKYCGAL